LRHKYQIDEFPAILNLGIPNYCGRCFGLPTLKWFQ
jgi:hypothetical protein